MSDFADLGLRFTPVGDQAANQALDKVTEKSVRAEKATDNLAASQKRAKTATGEMAASAQAAQAQVIKFEAAQNGSAAAATRLAQRAREAAQAVQSQATAATGAGQAMGSMGGAMTGVLIGFAALALAARGVAAAFQEARKATTFADDLVKAADKIGVSTKRLQELQFAATASGIAAGDVASSLGRLNGILGDIQTGGASKETLLLFKGLGFTSQQLNSYRSADELLPKVAEAISQLGTHAERVKVADMLGLGDLLPLLEKGSRNLSDLTTEADRLGVTLDGGAVRQAAELNRQLALNDQIIKSRLTQAFLDLAPAIKAASDLMVGIANGLAGVADWAGRAANAIEDWAKRHKNAVMAAAATVLPGGMGTAQVIAGMLRQPNWGSMAAPDRSFTVDRPPTALLFQPPKVSAGRSGGKSDAEREYERQTKASEAFAKALERETAEIGMNAEQKKALAVDTAALAAPTDALAARIRQAGDEWRRAYEIQQLLEAGSKRQGELDRAQSATPLSDQAKLAADQLGAYADLLDQVANHTQTAANDMAGAFGSVGAAVGDLMAVLTDLDAKQSDIAARRADEYARYQSVIEKTGGVGREAAQAEIRWQTAKTMAAREAAAVQIKGYGDQIGAFKGLFSEKSRIYKALTVAEQAFRVLELANSIRSMIQKGVEHTADAAGATLAAGANVAAEGTKTATSLAGAAIRIPVKIAEGAASIFSALGPFGFPVVAAMLAVMAGLGFSKSGGGSVPGANDAENRQKSQGTGSVLGDATAKSDSIAKSIDVLAKNSYEDLQFSNQMLRSLRSIDSQIGLVASALARSLGAGGALDTSGLNLGSSSSGPGLITRILAPISNLLPGLFGSKTTRTLQDQGLRFDPQSLTSILSGGINGQTYQQVLENTKKSFLGLTYSNTSKSSTTTGALDPDFTRQVQLLIGSLRDTVLAGAKTLGADGAQAAIDSFVVDLGKISLQGLKGSEIEDALKAVFSKLGDDLAAAAVPQLAELQKVGEGALETLSRVVHDYTTLDASLASIGKTFGAVGVSSLKAREGLIDLVGGLDNLVDATKSFAENYLTDVEQIAPVAKAVATEMARLGVSSIATKDQFKALVLAQDLTTEAGRQLYASLLTVAPAFAKVADFQATGSQAVQDARDALSKAYERESGALQDTIDKFDSFAQSLKKFRDQLYTGPAAQLSPEEQYKATKAAFEATSAKARAGDVQAIGDLQTVSQAYLDASKDYYASSKGYFADLEAVRVAVTATQSYAQGQADVARAQLSALNDMVSGILGTKDAVLSVHDALLAYQAAVAAQQTALNPTVTTPATTPATNDNNPTTPATRAADWASYLSHYGDVAAEYERNLASAKGRAYLNTLGIGSATDFAQWHYGKYGQAEGRTPFKTGGSFTVGGSGGEDSQAFGPLALSPGEMVDIRRPGQSDAVREEIRGLRADVARLAGQLAAQNRADVAQRAAIHGEAQKARGEQVETAQAVRKALRPAA